MKNKLKQSLLTLAIFMMGCIISILLSLAQNEEYIEHLNRDFSFHAVAMRDQIQNDLTRQIDALKSIQALYKASEYVDSSEFKNFSSDIIKTSPSIVALEWAPIINTEDKEIFEQKMRSEGLESFTIHRPNPVSNHIKAFIPITYVVPYGSNIKQVGFDLSADSERLTAMEKARDSGEISVMRTENLSDTFDANYGFFAFAPIYKNNAEIKTVDQRRKNITGYILGIYKI